MGDESGKILTLISTLCKHNIKYESEAQNKGGTRLCHKSFTKIELGWSSDGLIALR